MSERVTSYIKFINKSEKWGYIQKIDEGHARDYAFYPGSLSKSCNIAYEDLKEDTKVSFILQEKKDGLFTATDVEIADNDDTSDSFSKSELTQTQVQNTTPFPSNNPTTKTSDHSLTKYLTGQETINDSDLIIGIVSAVGTESSVVTEPLISHLKQFGYTAEKIRVSSLIKDEIKTDHKNEEDRIQSFIKAGDELRQKNNNAILAAGAVKCISEKRNKEIKKAFIIDSLKNPDEVEFLKKVYGHGFYLLGIHADKERRLEYLKHRKGCTEAGVAEELIEIDESEGFKHGQRTRDTYHLSDFYIYLDKDAKVVYNTLQRFLDLIFSSPYLTPTFDEYAMFMAFNSSVRSGDLSRQVGAVVAKNNQIIATGANDVPKAGGGLYWSEVASSGQVADEPAGKDYTRGVDSNKKTQLEMVSEIISETKKNSDLSHLTESQITTLKKILLDSKIRDLTEFGRIVHAEMEALLSCGREGISTMQANLYCTTFPCHNCAKHIIASGVKRVVYVEPYPKSKAMEFYSDSIMAKSTNEESFTNKVIFEPFIGVGPRRFLDLFSMTLGAGHKLIRKIRNNGKTVEWSHKSSSIRTPMIDGSYEQLEKTAIKIWDDRNKLTQ